MPRILRSPDAPRGSDASSLSSSAMRQAALNIHINPEFGGPQFQIGNSVRALGQPFTIVPLSALATARLLREQQGEWIGSFQHHEKPGRRA